MTSGRLIAVAVLIIIAEYRLDYVFVSYYTGTECLMRTIHLSQWTRLLLARAIREVLPLEEVQSIPHHENH
jgi:hypothetical protein